MKFIVSRTSTYDSEPCREAKKEDLNYLDYRTVKTLEEAHRERYAHWAIDWFKNGANHREDARKGMIVCERKRRDWVLEVKSLKALIAFVTKYGDVIIKESDYKEYPLEIEIYDGYRE